MPVLVWQASKEVKDMSASRACRLTNSAPEDANKLCELSTSSTAYWTVWCESSAALLWLGYFQRRGPLLQCNPPSLAACRCVHGLVICKYNPPTGTKNRSLQLSRSS